MRNDMRSELAIKRDEWFASIEGRTALDTEILHFESYAPLLKNRLEAAFLAGAQSSEDVGRELAEKTQRSIDATYEC